MPVRKHDPKISAICSCLRAHVGRHRVNLRWCTVANRHLMGSKNVRRIFLGTMIYSSLFCAQKAFLSRNPLQRECISGTSCHRNVGKNTRVSAIRTAPNPQTLQRHQQQISTGRAGNCIIRKSSLHGRKLIEP